MTDMGRLALSPKAAAADIVAMFMPEVGDAERALRARIHFARDTAQARRNRATTFESARLYAETADVACEWVFKRGTSLADLEEVIKILTWLFLAAGALERLEAPGE